MISSETYDLLKLIKETGLNNRDNIAIWAKKPSRRKMVLFDAIKDGLICSRSLYGDRFTSIQADTKDPFSLPEHLALTTKGTVELENYKREKQNEYINEQKEKREERNEKRSILAIVFSAIALLFSLISLIIDIVTKL